VPARLVGGEVEERLGPDIVSGFVLQDIFGHREKASDFHIWMAGVPATIPDELRYVGIALRGPDEVVRRMTKRFSLLR